MLLADATSFVNRLERLPVVGLRASESHREELVETKFVIIQFSMHEEVAYFVVLVHAVY